MNTEILYRKAKEQRYSIAALERAADLGNGTIGKWRDGKIEPMSKSLIKVAKVLSCTVDELLKGEK